MILVHDNGEPPVIPWLFKSTWRELGWLTSVLCSWPHAIYFHALVNTVTIFTKNINPEKTGGQCMTIQKSQQAESPKIAVSEK